MAQYKNYAGQLVTCPKAEGTCWQPEHLTRDQWRLKHRTKPATDGTYYESAVAGVAGDDSWVTYDAYAKAADEYDKKNKPAGRPKHTAGAAIWDLATEALDVEGVEVRVNPDEEDGRTGTVSVFTGKDSNDYLLDKVEYQYETRDGETTFYKKNRFFGRKEVDVTTIQKDIVASRDKYNRIENTWDGGS